MSRAHLICILTVLVACQVESAAATKADPAKEAPKAKPLAKAKPEAAKREAAKPSGDRATLSAEVPLPLTKLLYKTPPEVQALLGEPMAKGKTRESCLRFTPDRVWFECRWAWQRYADKTNTFKAIQVTYEDGKSADLSFEHLPGAGGFDVQQALAHVGLTLPGKPKLREPQPGTKVWEWFNDQARLVVDGQQYRVTLSVGEGGWETSKLDIILNSPLTEEQTKKIKPVQGKSG